MNQKANYKKYHNPVFLLKWGLNLILPPRCPVNGNIVDRPGAISPEAWKDLTFISDPKCTCCGIPFSVSDGEDNPSEFLCANCLSSPRPYETARAVFVYDNGSRPMILAFKHGDATHLHTTLAPLLYQTGQQNNIFTSDSVLVPVPLHWLRLLKRRYNQSSILSTELAKIANVANWPDALIRTRHTPPQGHKNARDRHQNVAHAFDITPSYASRISGKDIILIDDVFTTGATIEECAKVLKSAGAKTVKVLAIARAVKE